jgi:glutamate-1-semialdehyde 2,1-aminomutase
MDATLALYAAAATVSFVSVPRLLTRMDLSRAKHPSLRGHARVSAWLARQLPFYEYDDSRFFRSDDCPDEIAARRRSGFERLAALVAERQPRTIEFTAELSDFLSDLQFTSAYRVPFQYAGYVRRQLPAAAAVESSSGATLTDLDGNPAYDLAGSYGVNVFGYDFYKDCIDKAVQRARALGPVLGPFHPVVLDNVRRLRAISGLDEVSFHMSGTEAVMQAVRLARFHTRRSHLVRFCGSYHGWWGDVQPGAGNPSPARETYTLRDRDARSLHVLRTRRDIACVLVNPLQGLHPNLAAPGDSTLVDSSRRAGFDSSAGRDWLRAVREVCTERGIPLIFDEVFVGFRLARGGAQEYFGVRADMVTYGKTLGGGLPVGALCGRRDLMKRFREDRPADVSFARGTFNSHPYVMAAMNEFLRHLDTPAARERYGQADAVWNGRAERLNRALRDEAVPVQVANLSSIWTVLYTQPSRYNWMLQYYLRAEGLALSWVGTGRLIFSLDFTDADFDVVAGKFRAACGRMRDDGWWWSSPELTDKAIRRRILRELIARRLGL